jgi:hypothetical protein
VESRRAALALFEGQVPCFLKVAEPSCPAVAPHLAILAHEEASARCDYDEPLLTCGEHKRVLAMMSDAFWRTWHNLRPTLCGKCGTPLRVERFEPLGGGQ